MTPASPGKEVIPTRERASLSAARMSWATPRPISRIQRATALLLLAVMVIGLNFHIFFFQLYGWGNMVVEYKGGSESWVEAARQTLSGESQCGVCRQVESALWSNDQPLLAVSSTEEIPFQSIFFVLLSGSKPVVPSPSSSSETMLYPVVTPYLLAATPPAPPPRIALA